MAEKIEKSLLELDFASLTRRTFTPSPAAWEDQVLYFLLLDRFSDGNECGGHRDSEGRPVKSGTTPQYTPENPGRVDYDVWFHSGGSASPPCGSAPSSGRSRSSRPTTATASRTSSTWIPISGRARSSATSSGPPTSMGSTSSSISSPTTPATSSPTPRTVTRRTTRLRASGT